MHEVLSVDALFHAEYARLVRVLGVAFDPADAADAVQEAFIAADRRWRVVSTYSDPAGWIRRVALNRLLNGRRNHRRRSEILATLRPVADVDLSVELLDLRRSFAALPDRIRVTATLFYLADLPVEQIAEHMGISANTVKSNLHDARTRLRLERSEHSS
jgi:RNA polymerase sigma-70 factor (ECF subfamily)